MNGEQYSLSNLRDIVVPEAPPFWPPAPGVWIVLGIVTAVVVIICRRWLVSRKRNAYRRAGIVLLENAGTVRDVSVVLKRVALAAFPRKQVASLYGVDWASFLNRTCSRSDFSEIDTTDSSAEASQDLMEVAGIWIRYHRGPAPGILGRNPEP